LVRGVLSELFVLPRDLQLGENTVKVTLTDSENSRSAEGKVYLIDDIHDNVKWGTVKDSEVASGATAVLPITNMSIESGNSLTISATSSNKDALTIEHAFYNDQVHVIWDKFTNPKGNFFFSGSSAVIETQVSGNRQSASFSSCTQPDGPGTDVECKVLHEVPFDYSDVMGDTILELSKGTIVAYTYNIKKDQSTLIAVNEDQVFTTTHEGIITGIAGYPGVTAAVDLVALSTSRNVMILEVNPNDIEEWNGIADLDAKHYDVTDFCPTELRSQKVGEMGWFVILSNCHNGQNFSEQVFTWGVTKDTPTPTLPLSSLDNPKNICAFIGEIIVATQDRVYGVSLADDWNYWSIPLDELKVDRADFRLTCIESQNTAILTGYTEGTSEQILVKIRGNSGHRQDRRYPNTTLVPEADRINSFDFMGSTFHSVLTADGNTHFLQTYLDPKVIVKGGNVQADTKVEVHLTVTNGLKTANVVTNVTVKKAATQETVEKVVADQEPVKKLIAEQ
jgi:hypothetical protein